MEYNIISIWMQITLIFFIALPIWVCYIAIKIKFLEWWDRE